MNYSFSLKSNEKEMKNYFKNNSGFQIKDTILVKIINNGTKEWEQYKGSFKCVEEKSNLFFDEIYIQEEVYLEDELELVFAFPRIENNNTKGNYFTTIQLVYKNEEYNEIKLILKKILICMEIKMMMKNNQMK